MPGFLKVSGAQKTVASPYVKVSGTWKKASAGYIKVSGVWKQWYASAISDTFNRTNSSTLGVASNGFTTWNSTFKGSWGISSNKASTATSPSSYPMATVSTPSGTADFTANLDVTNGAGIAFWVSDVNNWWAVVSDSGSTTSHSCPSGGFNTGSYCIQYGYATPTIPQVNCGGYVTTDHVVGVSTYSLYSTGTTASAYNNQGICLDHGFTWVNNTCYSVAPACNSGDSLSGSTCYHGYTYCPSGYTDIGGTCTANNCSSGAGTDPCATCNGSPTCPSGYTLENSTTCVIDVSYAGTNVTTYSYSYKVIKSVSGTVSTLATYATSAAVASLSVQTTNSNVVINGYSAAAQTGTVTSNTYTATSPTRTSTLGIVLAPAGYSQGTTVDTFSAN